MNEINLLPRNLRHHALNAFKHQALIWTSIVLGGYIVVVAGVIGWWLWVGLENHQLADQLAATRTDLQKYATADFDHNLVNQRTQLALGFLSSRTQVASTAGTLVTQNAVQINLWKYAPAGQTLGITAGQAVDMEHYAEALQSMFPAIKITSFDGPSGTDINWAANLTL